MSSMYQQCTSNKGDVADAKEIMSTLTHCTKKLTSREANKLEA